MLRAETLYAPWDRSRFAVRLLDALEAGLQVEVSEGGAWEETYGPDLVDAALDLLMDGMVGRVDMRPMEGWSRPQYARRLAEAADCDPELVVARGPASAATATSPDRRRGVSFLTPAETTLERFVRDARAARRLGRDGEQRRSDETRLQNAA